MAIFSFSTRLNGFTLIHGYYNEEESRHNPIDVVRVVVVQVAVVVDIHEVGRVAQVGGALPPVVRNHPATRHRHQKIVV